MLPVNLKFFETQPVLGFLGINLGKSLNMDDRGCY